jgi:oligoribonuclease
MLLWIDLETTGLEAHDGEILEVGWFLTDNWEILSEAKSALVTPTKQTFELMKQDFVVSSMHTDNNLAAEMMLKSTRKIEDIEEEILDDIEEWATKDDSHVVLAGASVHFDRTFIAEYMWRLDMVLSHRHFDVSTLKMFFDDMGFYELGRRDTPTKHRALADIKDSYKLARTYVNLMNLIIDEGETNAERKPL